MMWMFHREGEYLSCEVRTCFDREGYELFISSCGAKAVEWFGAAAELERRWAEIRRELAGQGWVDLYNASPPPKP